MFVRGRTGVFVFVRGRRAGVFARGGAAARRHRENETWSTAGVLLAKPCERNASIQDGVVVCAFLHARIEGLSLISTRLTKHADTTGLS